MLPQKPKSCISQTSRLFAFRKVPKKSPSKLVATVRLETKRADFPVSRRDEIVDHPPSRGRVGDGRGETNRALLRFHLIKRQWKHAEVEALESTVNGPRMRLDLVAAEWRLFFVAGSAGFAGKTSSTYRSCCQTPTHEYVVPRSIPIAGPSTLAMLLSNAKYGVWSDERALRRWKVLAEVREPRFFGVWKRLDEKLRRHGETRKIKPSFLSSRSIFGRFEHEPSKHV